MTMEPGPADRIHEARDGDLPLRAERDIARELRLRPDPPRVMRISRKALVVLGAVASVGLAGAIFLALEPNQRKQVADELYATGRSVPAEGVASLPRDYSAIPKLGPPLPGEFGKPVLRQAERDGVPIDSIATGTATRAPVDPAVDQQQQDRVAAIRSGLFTGQSAQTANVGPELKPLPDATRPEQVVAQAAAASSAERREQFVEGIQRSSSGSGTLTSASPHVLLAGSVISAALVTGIRSDLPGQVVAQVTEPVFDSANGRTLLIAQGARLIGTYDSDLAAGQTRLLVAWTRLILTDGRSIDLGGMPAADAMGQSGLEDRTDHHWGGIARAALVSTVLGIGAQSGTSDNEGDIARALRDGASDSVSRTGRQIVERELNRSPTITIRPGFTVRVMLTRDLDFGQGVRAGASLAG
jgi:type IV secretion system protein VirB10